MNPLISSQSNALKRTIIATYIIGQMINPKINPKLSLGNRSEGIIIINDATNTLNRNLYGGLVFVRLNCIRNIGTVMANEAIEVANAAPTRPY